MSRKVLVSRGIFLAALGFITALCGASWARAAGGDQATEDRITVEEFKKLSAGEKPVVILDVRGHVETKIKGAKHIPLGELESRMKEIPEGSVVVTYCA